VSRVKLKNRSEGIKFCPKCGGVNINYDGASLGAWWVCNDCRYRAVNFPEKTKLNNNKNKK